MNQNLDNAIHGIQEARTALMVETSDAETHEEGDALTEIDDLLKEAENLVRTYPERERSAEDT